MDTMDNINNKLEDSAETSYGGSSSTNANKSFKTTEVYRYYQEMMYDEEEVEEEESEPKLNDFGDPNNIIDDDYDQQQQQHYIVRCFKCGELGHKRSDCLADFDDHQDMELLCRYSSSGGSGGGDADTSSSSTTITLDEKYLQEMLLLAESFLPKYLKKSLEKVTNADGDDSDGDDVGGGR